MILLSRHALVAFAFVALTPVGPGAFAQQAGLAIPVEVTPVVAKPAAANAIVAKPVATETPPNKFTAMVSLSQIVAPMLQLKVDYAIDSKMVVGGMLATGSPSRQGLTSYSQHEIGGFAGFYALGSARKGLGAVVQARGYMSSGAQNGDDGVETFTASGAGFSASGLLSARLETSSRLVLQGDAGLYWLYGTATAKGATETADASAAAYGWLMNLWVGLSF